MPHTPIAINKLIYKFEPYYEILNFELVDTLGLALITATPHPVNHRLDLFCADWASTTSPISKNTNTFLIFAIIEYIFSFLHLLKVQN